MKKLLILFSLLNLLQTMSAMDSIDTPDFIALIERSTDINGRDENGMTVLMWVAKGGRTKACRVLIENGADVNAKDNSDWTALVWAARFGNTGTCRALIEKDADVNVENENGYTVLMSAARSGHPEICIALMERGADVNVKDDSDWTALMRAARHGRTEICKAILSHAIILPKYSNKNDHVIKIRWILNQLKVAKDVQYLILGMLPLKDLLSLAYCKAYPESLRGIFIAKIEEYTKQQLAPMMEQAHSVATSDELKKLLTPVYLDEPFSELLHDNVKNAVNKNRLCLFIRQEENKSWYSCTIQ